MRNFGSWAIAALILPLFLAGCVVIESSAVGERDGSGQPVMASSSDYGILRLSVPDGLTADANSKLAAACPSGKLTNVQTELSMRDFIIVQAYKVSASALCRQ